MAVTGGNIDNGAVTFYYERLGTQIRRLGWAKFVPSGEVNEYIVPLTPAGGFGLLHSRDTGRQPATQYAEFVDNGPFPPESSRVQSSQRGDVAVHEYGGW